MSRNKIVSHRSFDCYSTFLFTPRGPLRVSTKDTLTSSPREIAVARSLDAIHWPILK